MNNIDESEQWKLNGDCEKCRRDKYCKKPCTINKRASEARLRASETDALNKLTGGCMSESINNLNNHFKR